MWVEADTDREARPERRYCCASGKLFPFHTTRRVWKDEIGNDSIDLARASAVKTHFEMPLAMARHKATLFGLAEYVDDEESFQYLGTEAQFSLMGD